MGRGYRGGLTIVKVNMAAHRDLVSAKRRAGAPQGSRGQRWRSGPGESHQVDWRFANVEDREASTRPKDMALVTSYVNPYPGPSLGGLAPLDLASVVLSRSFLEELDVSCVDPNDMVMTPALLGLRRTRGTGRT